MNRPFDADMLFLHSKAAREKNPQHDREINGALSQRSDASKLQRETSVLNPHVMVGQGILQ